MHFDHPLIPSLSLSHPSQGKTHQQYRHRIQSPNAAGQRQQEQRWKAREKSAFSFIHSPSIQMSSGGVALGQLVRDAAHACNPMNEEPH